MAEATTGGGRSPQGWINFALGLLVFALGVVLMLAAFYWGYTMLRGVDDKINSVPTVQAAPNPAAPAPAAKPGAKPAPPPVVQASPPRTGPTLLQVLSSAVLQLVTLLALAAIGAMVASRGAHLAGMKLG